MSDQSRALPDRPNLRYLKLEAKRRLAAGEFATLHQAQLAIAREHGRSSWTALKEHVEAADPASHALTQVRWVMSRFAAADTPRWSPPVAGHPGAGSGSSASLIIRPGGGGPWVVYTNRQVLVEAVNERLAFPIA